MAASVAVPDDPPRPGAAKDKATESIHGISLIMAIGCALVAQEEPHVEYQLMVF